MNKYDSYQDHLEAAKEFIAANDDFLVVSHINPDGDAVSSTCAMGLILQALNKKCTMINEGQIPRKFHLLPGSREIVNYSAGGISRKFQRVICVDCADYQRVDKVSELYADDVQILNIDHHPTNNRYGTVNVIFAEAAATAEILHDLAEHLQIPWNEPLATCIYTGLMTDTGGFRYANTTPKVMRIAAKLLAHGVNGNRMAEELLERISYAHIHLLKKALATLSFSADKKISWLVVSKQDYEECGASNEDLEGLVNYPRNIEGVEVGILFKEQRDGQIKISLRSSGTANVAKIAQSFGGGGHIRAAGATIAGELDEVVTRVVKQVENSLERNE